METYDILVITFYTLVVIAIGALIYVNYKLISYTKKNKEKTKERLRKDARNNKLIDSDLTGVEIGRLSGVPVSTVRNLRLGTVELNRLTFLNAENFYNCALELEKEGRL